MKNWGQIAAIFLLVLTACNEEDYHYPDVVTNLVELETDGSSNIHLIRTDDGAIYFPDKIIAFKDATPDSLYRVNCTYQPLDESGGKATLYNVKGVLSPFPKEPSYFKDGIKTDPLKITSIWNSGGYINLHLGVMTKGGKHKYHFLNLGKSKNSMGKSTQLIQLFHSQEKDPEAYTQEIFLSCPLRKLDLHSGDSIIFSINTYEGVKVYKFLHQEAL